MSLLPRSMGRYEVTARLAAGGMAEILLGRLTGPSGFERAVVIKRIHPHLALSVDFREMFLDEARIAARIHHPNVAQVHELGQDGDELFLVMEYVAGESCSGLQRRALVRKQPLPAALALHIVAEACAGLHAAHELVGTDGEPLSLIHRDISPENILVAYDGSAKLLDFGVAKAANRIAQTEAGVVKGKFAYMSPEQSRGEALDRRSDIFSLGVVLYELLAARRLFRRENQPATLKALWSLDIVPPSTHDATLPPEVDEVCLRALSRDPVGRFPSAAEMRAALLTAARGLQGPAAAEQALAAYMAELFDDRIAAKKAMLRHVSHGSDVTEVPAAEADSGVELPTVEGASLPARVETPPPGGRRRAAFGVAAVVAAAGAGYFASTLGGAEPKSPAAAAAASAESAPSAPTATASSAPAAKTVSIEVSSQPPGAVVKIGGRERGTTPVDVSLPRSDDKIVLVLERTGHRAVSEEVVPDRDQRIKLTLPRETTSRPTPAVAPTPAAPKPATSAKGAFERWE